MLPWEAIVLVVAIIACAAVIITEIRHDIGDEKYFADLDIPTWTETITETTTYPPDTPPNPDDGETVEHTGPQLVRDKPRNGTDPCS